MTAVVLAQPHPLGIDLLNEEPVWQQSVVQKRDDAVDEFLRTYAPLQTPQMMELQPLHALGECRVLPKEGRDTGNRDGSQHQPLRFGALTKEPSERAVACIEPAGGLLCP